MADLPPVDLTSLTPDTLLTRPQAASALTKSNRPISPETLSTLASRGGGPNYRLWGKRALYSWGDLLSWAEARLSAPQAVARRRAATAHADAA
jgi:hypothetical protein